MQIISVPYFIGQRMDGFEVPSPATVLTPPLPHDDVAYDMFHADGPGGVPQQRMASLYSELATLVAGTTAPLVYAGDCLSVIGVLAGLQHKGMAPTLYWFDAHGDFHTWGTTRSRFLGGMPLAMLTGRGEQTIVNAVGLTPLADTSIVLVDARDLDETEVGTVTDSAMTRMTVEEVASGTPPPGPIYVHVDVDVVDPSDLPAINYPAPNGPGAVAVAAAVRHLAATGRVVAASVSSWNPVLDGSQQAADTTLSIMAPFLDLA